MYTRWAERHGFTVEEQDLEPNMEAGIQSVTFKVIGEYAYGYLQSEIGVHRLVRISPFGVGDTRQTSLRGRRRGARTRRRHRDRGERIRTRNADVLLRRPRRAAPEQDAVGRPADPQVAASAARAGPSAASTRTTTTP